MNSYTFLGLAMTVIGSILMIYGGTVDIDRHSKKEKEDAFKKVIDSIVFGENSDANMTNFSNFLAPEINDDQLKYIYEQVSTHPIRGNTYDFLGMFVMKKSKFAEAFYINLLRKNQGLKEVERSLVYNCFQKDNASVYEKELRTYILKTANPTREFIEWCEFLTQTNNINKINFLVNLFNDNQLIEKLNKPQLKEKCKEWEESKDRFDRLAPSWQGTYFEDEIVKLRTS